MAWGALFMVLSKLLSIISWPSFNLVIPLYASFWVIESDSSSKNQQCLTFWVLFASFMILEQTLASFFNGCHMFLTLECEFGDSLPFWPHVKGLITVLLAIRYFGGASYVYKHFMRPYLSEDSLIWKLLFIQTKKCLSFCGQNNFIDAADTNIIEDGQNGFGEYILSQKTYESGDNLVPKNNNTSGEYPLPTGPEKVQKEWSCALCLISTTKEKCLKEHLRGKKHRAMEEKLRAEELGMKINSDSSLMVQRDKGMVALGNLVNLYTWSGLLNPVTGSIKWCRWKKPDFGWIKLNTDGSLNRENAGFGGLLRDHKGGAICAFVSKAPKNDIFSVELWAIWRGLVLALGLGVKLVWVESDSESVVKTINRKQPYSGKADSCLKHIWQLLKRFEKCKVSHSWRETNKAADYLAGMATERSDVVLWPADFPNSLVNIIKDDAEGKIYCRR